MFNTYLEEISNPAAPLVTSRLVTLSNMSREEESAFRAAWLLMGTERRLEIASSLVLLAEDNAELNFDPVFKIGMDDENPQIRVQSLEGLFEYEARDLIRPLSRMLRQDPDAGVRAAVGTALGRFAMRAALGKLRPEDVREVEEVLLSIIDDEDEAADVRRRCVEAIAPLCRPRVNQVIHEAYRSRDLDMKASAIHAMGRNCEPRWLPTLLKELESPEDAIRYEAAVATGALGPDAAEAVPQLVRLVYDTDAEVQAAALAALGEVGGNEAKRALRSFAQDENENVRALAAQALEELVAGEDPLGSSLFT